MSSVHDCKEVDLFELIDKVHVPEINRVFAEYNAELCEPPYKDRYDEFKAKKSQHFKTLCEPEQEFANGEFSKYWFEITRYREGEWRITAVNPAPLPHTFTYGFMPRDVIQQLTEVQEDPDHVEVKIVESKDIGRRIKVLYVRASATFIYGVCMHLEPLENWERDMHNTYRVFYQYLRTKPDVVRKFIHNFMTRKAPELKLEKAEPGYLYKDVKAGAG